MLEDTQSDVRSAAMADEGQSPMVLLAYYWSLVRKYYWIVLVTSILSVTAGYFWTKQQPKLYRTSSTIIFHNKDNALGKQIDRVDLMDPGGTWQFERAMSPGPTALLRRDTPGGRPHSPTTQGLNELPR